MLNTDKKILHSSSNAFGFFVQNVGNVFFLKLCSLVQIFGCNVNALTEQILKSPPLVILGLVIVVVSTYLFFVCILIIVLLVLKAVLLSCVYCLLLVLIVHFYGLVMLVAFINMKTFFPPHTPLPFTFPHFLHGLLACSSIFLNYCCRNYLFIIIVINC